MYSDIGPVLAGDEQEDFLELVQFDLRDRDAHGQLLFFVRDSALDHEALSGDFAQTPPVRAVALLEVHDWQVHGVSS
jgi:hypothetical protein